MADLLFEIGCEELPASFIQPALETLRHEAERALSDARLRVGEVRAYGSPRRLALVVAGLADRQAPRVTEVRGPAAAAAFDAEGRPTRAAEGFARSRGVTADALVRRQTDQGEYVFARVEEPSVEAGQVLPELLRGLVERLRFPKSMRWDQSGLRFARPIRWLVAVLDGRPLPVEAAGLRAGTASRGHRLLAPGVVEVDAASYLERLRERRVLADPQERREEVRRQAEAVAARAGGRLLAREGLLDEVAGLVEWPSALEGHFPEAYLELPDPVLVTPMEAHQRYFPVAGPDGRLQNRFVAVSNGDPGEAAVIVRGHERVLKARLADAAFFYREDLERSLEERVAELAGMSFHGGLGSFLEKTARLEALAQGLAAALDLPEEEQAHFLRAAHLSKADLVTHMVYEFPELQGVMGREYARAQGEPEPVAVALEEQYRPRGAGEPLPETRPGALLAVADRADSLAGAFVAGLTPTGSQDPYGVRRAALGILAILEARGLDLALPRLVRRALEGYGPRVEGLGLERIDALEAEILDFLRQRMRGVLLERGYRYDLVDAVLSARFEQVPEVLARLEAFQRWAGGESFDAVRTAFGRVANLVAQARSKGKAGAVPGEVVPELLQDPAERELARAFGETRREVTPLLAARSYGPALEAMASLRPLVDRFFDEVLVMAPEPELQANRLNLLGQMTAFFDQVCDWRRVVEA
ncbi:glycine--tRNA ligase subunit beta [Limnochorda pilosa]|uniref:Glycine--tRNA ligase beta subunit n=1 Tax=Limnochorda pilosa TaxID=1555112 RepID=A0A0K2SMT1_LIMPI|nr:glycine--tRNA ligase subunit beta [Limnochorda pilosa]BAS28312.1 glycyl-tRNA synthetase subunit beta [Limnochorda pilosa]